MCNHRHLLPGLKQQYPFLYTMCSQSKELVSIRCYSGQKYQRVQKLIKEQEAEKLIKDFWSQSYNFQFRWSLSHSLRATERFYPGNYDCTLSCCYRLTPAIAHSGMGTSYVSLLGKKGCAHGFIVAYLTAGGNEDPDAASVRKLREAV